MPTAGDGSDQIAEFAGSIRFAATSSVFRGLKQGLRILQEGFDTCQQRFGREAAFGHHPCPARIGHGIGVHFLLVVAVYLHRDKDGGASGDRDFGDRTGARSCNYQMRFAQLSRNIIEEGFEFGLNSGFFVSDFNPSRSSSRHCWMMRRRLR